MILDATPLLRRYARRRLKSLAAQDAAETQRRQLSGLVRAARGTRFGREHGFDSIRHIGDFQARVPLRRYEDFWEAYWREPFPRLTNVTWPGTIPYFAVTSGTTTGRTKYIPVSRAMVASNRRAAVDLLVHHIANRPQSRVLGGKNFMLGGSSRLVVEADGIRSGDLSGIAAREVPWWARPYYYPPSELARIEDWARKVDALGTASVEQDIRTIGGTTSWLLLYFDRLRELMPERGERIADFYPHLELLVHGGVNFEPYRARIERLLEGGHAEPREVYPASEGFIAIADKGSDDGLRVLLDNGLFLEFVPVEDLESPAPRRHWIGTVETDVNYAVVLSCNAGLWAYILGDTVRFVHLSPPRLVVTGRTSYTLSAFGEHLIGEEIESAVSGAARRIGADITDWSVGAVHPQQPGERGGHLYIAEFTGDVPDGTRLSLFTRAIDEDLSARNDDYRAHRAGGFGMAPPRVKAVPPGTFAAWMRRRGKLGGQNKVPRVINDEALFRSLVDFGG